jgi:hypothetical protein
MHCANGKEEKCGGGIKRNNEKKNPDHLGILHDRADNRT